MSQPPLATTVFESKKQAPDQTAALHDFENLKEKVLSKKPVLKDIIEKRGHKTLHEYAKGYFDIRPNPHLGNRQEEFLGTFSKIVEARLGAQVAKEVCEQMKLYYYVSTADHHGPICHPFFLNPNLLSCVPFTENPDPKLKYVIVLSCGNVSLNNSSYPRGVMFHSYSDNQIQTHSLPFFPASHRLCPVYNFRSYTKEEIERAKKSLKNLNLKPDVAEKLNSILTDIYQSDDALNSKNYSEQITKTNYKLWKQLFRKKQLPADLIYIDQEEVVSQLLIDHHLTNKTTINEILFNPEYENLIMEYFEGIQGAFSKHNKWGTYLFWALPAGAKYRIQLWKKGNKLVSEDGAYEIEMTPVQIKLALERRELIPNMLLTFKVLCFYYGVKCLGGFSQVNYLTFMKTAYMKMQEERHDHRSMEICSPVQTKELSDSLTLAFLQTPDMKLTPATSLDLILYGHDNAWATLIDQSNTITLAEALYSLLPEIYRVIYPEKDREEILNAITSEQITELIGLTKKIKPCCSIS